MKHTQKRAIFIIALSCMSGGAIAQSKVALIRDVDRAGGNNQGTFSCMQQIGVPLDCSLQFGPTVQANTPPKFVTDFVSYRVRYVASSKLTSISLFCGTSGFDWLPVGAPMDGGDGTFTVSWGGPITKVYTSGCTGSIRFEINGLQPISFDAHVSGHFEAPFP